MLIQPAEFLYHTPAHQTEVSGINRNFHLSHRMNDFVSDLCDKFFQKSLPFPIGSLGINNLVAFLPFAHHFTDYFRRILQIHIDDNTDIAAAV